MNVFRRLLTAIERRAVSFWSDKLSWGGLFAGGQMAASGVLVTPEKALALTSYYAAINRIATDVAGLPFRVYRRRGDGGADEVTDHPVSELLSTSPNGETTPMRWKQAAFGHMLGWGNAYAEIETDKGGRPIGLHLMDPATTSPERRPQDKRLFYRHSSGTLPPARVLHLAGFGWDGLKGYSPAHIARECIGLGLASERFGGAFFGNGIRPSGVIELPYKLKDKAAVDQLRMGWATEYAGPDNAGKVPVLEQGATFKITSIPPEDAQFLQTRQFQVIEIARLFGIPPHKIGDYSSTGSAYRALEEANLDYLATTIVPWCESIEQSVNLKLLTASERRKGYFCEHNVSAFLRGDSKARGEFYGKLMGLTVITPNDIARRENLNPIGPDGDRRYLSTLYQPLDVALNPPAAAKPAPDGGPPAADAEPDPGDGAEEGESE